VKQIGFDFEEMTLLIQEDPALFARRREELIRHHIEKSPQPNSLAQLQMSLDEVRYSTQPGLRSGEKILEMMIEYSTNLALHLERLRALLEASCATASHTNSTCEQSVRHNNLFKGKSESTVKLN
jgi:hypothetical protein